jgi:NitT/TauT family transport system substrate-binding protein
MKRRKIGLSSVMVFLAAGLLLLAGCAKKDAALDTPAVNAEGQKNLGTLRVGWFPGAIKMSLTNIAYQLGYFAEEGVTIEPIVLQNIGEMLTALEVNKLDIVPGGISIPLQFISEKSDIVIIGGSAMEGGVIVTLPERADEFRDWENWRGKKYGSARSMTGDYVVRDHLRNLGILTDRDYTFVDLGTDNVIIQGVVKGAVDVGYITADGVIIAKDMGLEVILNVGTMDPGYPCCRQNTSSRVIEAQRDVLVGYLRSLIRAYKVIYGDRDTAIKIVRELSGQSRAYVESGLYGENASKYNPAPARSNVLRFNQYLLNEGIVKDSGIDLNEHIDSTIFADALNQILERYPDDPVYLELKAFFEESEKI